MLFSAPIFDLLAIASVLSSVTPTLAQCISTTVSSFNLAAVYTSPPPAGPFSLGVKFLQVYTVPHEGWGIASVCPTCTSAYSYSTLASGVWAPYVNGLQQPKSMGFSVGETPVFKSVFPYPAGYAGYCTMLTSAGSSGPTLLAFNGHADLWSVCANNTASGRLDIVYSPVSGHAHYSLSDCSAVTLQLV